jgi:hypothetical protein
MPGTVILPFRWPSPAHRNNFADGSGDERQEFRDGHLDFDFGNSAKADCYLVQRMFGRRVRELSEVRKTPQS